MALEQYPPVPETPLLVAIEDHNAHVAQIRHRPEEDREPGPVRLYALSSTRDVSLFAAQDMRFATLTE